MFSCLCNHRSFLASAALAFVFINSGPASAAFKQIRDSWVLCDYASNCTLTLNSETQGAPSFNLYRNSAVGAQPLLRLSNLDSKPVSGQFAIAVDGKPAISVAVSTLKSNDDQFDYNNAADVARLMDAMKAGQKLTLQLGNKRYSYSLSGFVGGLIYLDEQQARNGTVAALQAKGKKPAPPAPDVSLITASDQLPERIRPDFTDENGVCGTSNGSSFNTGGGFKAKIGDGLSMIAMPCGSPGAYNQSYVFYSQYENQVVPVSLPTISDDGPSTVDEAWNIDWSQSTKTLTAFFKGRGLGDCGTYDVWKATDDGDGKVRFVLAEERSKGDCDGNYAGGPEKWPASWPISAK